MSVRVRLQAKGRLRIVGADVGSREADSLRTWLAARDDVRSVELRDKTGVFIVEYEDHRGLPGRFPRALNEEIARMECMGCLERADEETPFSVAPVHSLHGRVRLRVEGLSEDELARFAAYAEVLVGVEHALASAPSSTVLLRYDPTSSTEEQLVALLGESLPGDWPSEPPRGTQLRWGGAVWDSLVLVAAVSGALPTPIVVAGVLSCMARPIRRSLHALTRGTITIDLLDMVATGVALVTGLPGTAAFIVWMVGVGDLMLDFSADKARAALASVMRMQEHDAFRVLPGGGVERVRVERLEVGDRFLAGTGHSVATDGIVVTGTAAVDESSLTGESRYVDKSVGATVYASTLIAEGELVVEVVRPGKASEAAKILSVLGTAGSKPLTLQDDALRFAGSLVAPTFGVAAFAGWLASDIDRTTCVLITDFGTGFRIAVPTSALTSLTLAAREGVLVKGAQYLERLSKTDVVVFDKTGTLTCGVPEVVEVLVAEGFTAPEVVLLAASAESRHDHPVAKALKAYAEKLGRSLLDTELGGEDYFLGRGLETKVAGRVVRVGSAAWMQSMGHELSDFREELTRLADNEVSTVFVEVDGMLAGIAGYRDTIRPESASIVKRLKAGGRRKIILLSGDTKHTVQWVAEKVGVDESVGPLLPAQKADYVKKLREEGHVVAMIGDGINDAPALALADVGISIAGSTEAAVEMADVVLMEGGLTQLAEVFDISDRAMTGVRRSLAAVLIPNGVAIAFGAAGLIRPPLAAIINNGATVLSVMVGTAPLTMAPAHPFTRRQRDEAIRKHIRRSMWTAVITGWPPFLHDPALSSVYVAMFGRIGKDHGLHASQLPWGRVARTITNALAARHVAVLPVQWIPGVALAARMTTAAALTQILGRYMVTACRDPEHVPVIPIRVFSGVLRKIVHATRLHPHPSGGKRARHVLHAAPSAARRRRR